MNNVDQLESQIPYELDDAKGMYVDFRVETTRHKGRNKKLTASGSKTSISDEILKEKIDVKHAKYEQRDRALMKQQQDRDYENFWLNYNVNKRLYTLPELLNELKGAEKLQPRQAKVNPNEKGSSTIPKGKKKKKTQKKNKSVDSKGIQGGVKKPKGKCFHCGQKGHRKKQCQTWLSKNTQGVPGN
ncbi:uncharacterized protein LOC120005974 [Tripterygium wilfordii]|uniref:uncharacterized protein LOC120005974 n=1 Tax=Tripterygium wilfordii TaxID=458696 RepID=UPI0018F85497|nr:uncharacterized protein LOC120005974 [Tripterygium wilfordii]